MRPYKDIRIGDKYRVFGGREWNVEEKNNEEKMVKIREQRCSTPSRYNKAIWVKNTNQVFGNRV